MSVSTMLLYVCSFCKYLSVANVFETANVTDVVTDGLFTAESTGKQWSAGDFSENGDSETNVTWKLCKLGTIIQRHLLCLSLHTDQTTSSPLDLLCIQKH